MKMISKHVKTVHPQKQPKKKIQRNRNWENKKNFVSLYLRDGK
jgi:hypothetical protein